jgi:tRNA nucleotidyltransferase (CCA-adding enzyme)
MTCWRRTFNKWARISRYSFIPRRTKNTRWREPSTERKQGSGYTGFVINADAGVSLEDDLLRRDLTINAIAKGEQGELIDPYGGQADLQARLLRHVSPAFVEDPLRVLRVARFAARYAYLGFTVAEETMALMAEISSGDELLSIAPERLWTETQTAMSEQTPSVYFQVLRQCGALRKVFPEVDALFGVPQRKDYHPEIDTGLHTMMVVDAAAALTADVAVRFAALTHDLGKANTPEDVLPSHIGHEKRGLPLIRQLCERLRVPNQVRELSLLVGEFHTHAHRALELKPTTLLQLLERLDVFRRPERITQFAQACMADSQGRTGFEEKPYPQADYLLAAASACQGISAQGLIEQGLQGKEIGAGLRRLRLQEVTQLKAQHAHLLEPFKKD